MKRNAILRNLEGAVATASKKPFVYGALASLLLVGFYFGILTLVSSFAQAIYQFKNLWIWMTLLIIGFGVQVGMFFNTRILIKTKAVHGATGAVAGAGGVSAGSMVACCLHRVTDVLPLLGISAFAVFLTQYQVFFLILGILSNVVGIAFMLSIMQNHGLLREGSKLGKYNLRKVKNLFIGASVLVLVISFAAISFSGPASAINRVAGNAINLEPQVNDENMVSVEVTPENFNFDGNAEFYIALNTHSGDLGFELTEIAELTDNLGNIYKPIDWDGSAPGGHHRYGTLTFPKVDSSANVITLNLYGIRDIPKREFTWSLTK